ncbi:MAG: YraN family protein [Mogibacterium sp.]|nr:YraN family protein [Mogibacterium sp.]
MRYRKNVGDYGEEFAALLLENSGFRVIERNYAIKAGEIDIIAIKDGTIHFIEVKTRTGNQYGYPSDSVNRIKQQRIRRAAESYLSSRRLRWNRVAFDVYEIMTNHIEDCM